jgi:hypothetical protein
LGITPDICYSSLALFIRIAKISTTILNRIGDNGSPCLNPFLFQSFGLPDHFLSFISTCPPSVKDNIHLHQVGEKPFVRRVCCKEDQLILSYAFSKSIFKIIPLFFFLCIPCMVSCDTMTPSIMFLPGKKAVWDGLMTFSAIWVTLFVATLIKIFKLTFNKHIGLYCCIFC